MSGKGIKALFADPKGTWRAGIGAERRQKWESQLRGQVRRKGSRGAEDTG